MAVDYAGAIDMSLPGNYEFNSDADLSIVVHETGGDMTLDAVHQTFLATMRSTHFAIDLNGAVAQFVPLNRGAGGNCCPDTLSDGSLDCDPYWIPFKQQYGNLNLCTISIEHCNNSTNTLPMTQAQIDASNKLIYWLAKKYGLTLANIKGHNSINPRSKPNCPGTFSFSQLAAYFKSQEVNPNMGDQFDAVWYSGGIGSPSHPTGIYQAFKNAFLAGKCAACFPLKHIGTNVNVNGELSTEDWNNNPIIWQSVSTGLHAEDNNGTIHIFDPFSHEVA